MKKIINAKTATNANLILFVLFIFFHLLVITGIIPLNIVWGGRISNRGDLINCEAVSLLILIICIIITLIKVDYIKIKKIKIISHIGMWCMFFLFLLNTIGNLLAITMIEKLVFTPITILLSLFSLRLAVEKL